MTPETVELDIHAIAAGGDGVGRVDGLVVFAPRTAPGDHVRATIERGKRFARASHTEILTPSSDRVAPACRHYDGDACGGCQLQHLSDGAQRRAKAGMIRDAFTRIAKRPLDLPEVRHGRSPWRYRAKLTLALRRTSGGWTGGLHRFDDSAAVFALDDCPITDQRVLAVWRDVLAHGVLLPDAPSLRGSVRLLGDGAAFVVQGGSAWERAADLLEAVPSLVAVWWVPEGDGALGKRRYMAGRGPGEEYGASFTQVNAEVAEMMRAHVLALVRSRAPRRVVDAYAGVGDTAEPIAREGAHVVAIELDRDASRACAARLPAGSRAVAGTVEGSLPGLLPADLVLLNPPRAGVADAVTRALEAAVPRAASIIYVSCDPATLARDVGRLPSYRVSSVTAFDMFPQTAHVETVCELRLEGMPA
ncbi:MAG: TRAM domain-containing protein [Gemmatimonadaceae bacterium]